MTMIGGLYWTMAALTAGWVWSQMVRQVRWVGSWRGVWEMMRLSNQLDGTDPLRMAPRTEFHAAAALAAVAAVIGMAWPLTLLGLGRRDG